MTVDTRDTPIELDDYLDVRDIIARIEYLRALPDEDEPEDGDETPSMDDEEKQELAELLALMVDLEGMGGDEQWEGTWYPLTLIRDSYFEDYARELADDLYGNEMSDSHWPFTCIDWESAARELRMDYSPVEFRDVTYWTR